MKHSSKEADAFNQYLALGPGRSLPKLTLQVPYKQSQLERWSVDYGWQARVAEHDARVAEQVATDAANAYAAAVEDHRVRYLEAGRKLYEAAMKTLDELIQSGELKQRPSALVPIMRAFTTAADLEAHALHLDKVMRMVTPDDTQSS